VNLEEKKRIIKSWFFEMPMLVSNLKVDILTHLVCYTCSCNTNLWFISAVVLQVTYSSGANIHTCNAIISVVFYSWILQYSTN
jgi:hypothetical protein